MATQRICSIPDCGKPHNSHGLCAAHDQMRRRHGDPLAVSQVTQPNAAQNFLQDVVLTYEGDDCLTWPYAKSDRGYGRIGVGRGTKVVSRLVCELAYGPAPTPEHQAAHSCGKGHLACVTKRHLSWKTHTENLEDIVTHGTRARGERHGGSILTEAIVREIRELGGSMPHSRIAERFGVSRPLVSMVIGRKRWTHFDSA